MTFSTFTKASVLFLALFSSTALSQGPENRGYGVLDPSLTGTRPPYKPEDVRYWETNDPSYVNANLFQQQMLAMHNKYRSEHGVGPVAWDASLAKSSQTHVDTCVYGHSVSLSRACLPLPLNQC